MLNGRSVDLDGTLKWSHGRTFVAPGEKYQQNLAIRTEDTGHVSKFNFVLKHCFSLETFIPKFVAFFVPLGIVIFCIRKMSFLGSFGKTEFTPAIVSLSTSREVDNVN